MHAQARKRAYACFSLKIVMIGPEIVRGDLSQ
jgi:hypothetical protein